MKQDIWCLRNTIKILLIVCSSMGYLFADQYSLLHFATGVMVYFFNIGWAEWFVLHGLFELLENTETGMGIINENFPFWPGGKPAADHVINSAGDQVFAMLGWFAAYLLDHFGKKYGWYDPHLL